MTVTIEQLSDISLRGDREALSTCSELATSQRTYVLLSRIIYQPELRRSSSASDRSVLTQADATATTTTYIGRL